MNHSSAHSDVSSKDVANFLNLEMMGEDKKIDGPINFDAIEDNKIKFITNDQLKILDNSKIEFWNK